MLFSNEQVQAQKERFESFMQSVNLQKVGERYFYFQLNDNEDGKYNNYCYILKVLKLVANVGGCYYCPGTNLFYSDIFKVAAMNAYLDSLLKKS